MRVARLVPAGGEPGRFVNLLGEFLDNRGRRGHGSGNGGFPMTVFPMRPTGIRGQGFRRGTLQRVTGAMPTEIEVPYTPDARVWAFLAENPRLVRHAARHVLPPATVRRMTDTDLAVYIAPFVARAFAEHRADGGSSLVSFTYRWMMGGFYRASYRLYGVPGVRGDRRRPPFALGDYTPEGPDHPPARPGPDPAVTEAAMDALAGLDARRRQTVCMFLGLGGPRRSHRYIAGVLGVSWERVRQLYDTALAQIRGSLGITWRVRKVFNNATKSPLPLAERQRRYQAEYRKRKAAGVVKKPRSTGSSNLEENPENPLEGRAGAGTVP